MERSGQRLSPSIGMGIGLIEPGETSADELECALHALAQARGTASIASR